MGIIGAIAPLGSIAGPGTSALSNLGSRLASVCGPLVLGFTWTFLASFSVQMVIGMLIIDGFAVLNLLFAWLSVQRRSQRLSTSQEAA